MASAADLERCFGVPRGYSGVDAWEELEAAAGQLPADYKEYGAGYGPGRRSFPDWLLGQVEGALDSPACP